MNAQAFADRLSDIPNVVGVALGGSRATGTHRPDSDWDFGLYYRGSISADEVRALGYEGVVVEPGEWGRIVNGGAWLTIDGERADILYRDLDAVEHWLRESEEGRYEVDNVAGQIAGTPTYVLAGELAINQTLAGELPKAEFPAKLRETAPSRWLGSASFSLTQAEAYAKLGAMTQCVGSIARATVCAAQARLAEQGEWALNEKRIVADAGFGGMDSVLARASEDAASLASIVEMARGVLGLARPTGLRFDEVNRR